MITLEVIPILRLDIWKPWSNKRTTSVAFLETTFSRKNKRDKHKNKRDNYEYMKTSPYKLKANDATKAERYRKKRRIYELKSNIIKNNG